MGSPIALDAMNRSIPSSSRNYGIAAIHFLSILVSKALPWVLAILLIRAVADAAVSLSGAPNLLSAWVELSGNLKVTRGFAFIFGGMGFLYGLQQRRLRLMEQTQASSLISETLQERR
jgi:hypothetical protein